jgi:hypothetical protein
MISTVFCDITNQQGPKVWISISRSGNNDGQPGAQTLNDLTFAWVGDRSFADLHVCEVAWTLTSKEE